MSGSLPSFQDDSSVSKRTSQILQKYAFSCHQAEIKASADVLNSIGQMVIGLYILMLVHRDSVLMI